MLAVAVFPLGSELFADECIPSVFVLRRDRFAQDLCEVGASLDADDVQCVAFCFHEQRLEMCVGI